MNDQAFAALEYDALRALLQRGAQTPAGRARCGALLPLSDVETVQLALRGVTEAVRLRERGLSWSFADLIDPTEALARLRIEDAALDPFSLLELARLLEQAGAARALLHSERETHPVLWNIVVELPRDAEAISARITSKINPSGELDDRASPELARTRSEIARLRSSITRSLENLMRREETIIQDQIVTLRNDRFVIPVRSDTRSRLPGVAHGFSSSGATVFVEPLETIEANNELQALREREEREIAEILARLTQELREALPTIERAASAVSELDFIRAKASLAARLNSVEPQVNDDGALELADARHPLLDEQIRAGGGAGAVPASFALNPEHPVMVISGANAGGKTVVLKTAGLLALMALSGLHVPARKAAFPLYRSVLADIGDSQSLAANLSTFTAHVRNISRMIDSCRPPALVLLDEVGTGTDPEEGSALGVAVVDHFRRACEAHVIATTHYSGLKIYATNDESVTNASVEFDEKTLQPTYRLLLGHAGASSGLEIARRFGFPETVVDAARGQVSDAARETAEYTERLRREAETATDLRRALEEERAAVAERYAALDVEAMGRERERQTAFEREMQQAVRDFETEARALVSKIEDRTVRARAEREAERRAAELRRETERAARERRAATATASESSSPGGGVRVVRRAGNEEATGHARVASDSPSRDIKAGDRVRVRSLNTTGLVERLTDGRAEILVGSLRFKEKVDNLELLESTPQRAGNERGAHLKQKTSRNTEVNLRSSQEEPLAELKLIGRTTDEAVDETDKFLDEAYLNNLSPLRIIHGIGTGALKRAISNFLKSHPHVARFTQAPPEQGGAGATIVELKQ
ncbi:MAG: Smr/MutS family protein [Pyrinomonadaceae bacterium]|nr:Smr/MutS family protein [Pyrinomonadaceae bacterium]